MLFIFLVTGQIVIYQYIDIIKINIDCLFLILVYISLKSSFLKSILAATAIGLVTDFFSGNVLGVFGFSRTVSAYLISEFSKYLDLEKFHFQFLLISITLFISNLIANTFFYFIFDYNISLKLVLYPPLLTGFVGMSILLLAGKEEYLDVY